VGVGRDIVLARLLACQFAVAAIQAEQLFLVKGELLALRDRLCLVAADVLMVRTSGVWAAAAAARAEKMAISFIPVSTG
jgi:hypothetical protein